MDYDICMIILTAFAMLGVYCFLDTVFTLVQLRNMPPSVMILKNSTDYETMKKIKFAEQNIPNNSIFLYPTHTENDVDGQKMEDYIKDVLNVNIW